ncbi:MAG: flagellar hook-basal body complex protein FliE [Actinomycetota bacterium]|nr:flagellar hook-basal body complex protein FliE [Actinomycetota bacterium]
MIPPLSAVGSIPNLTGPTAVGGTAPTSAATSASGGGFGQAIGNAIASLQGVQANASNLAVQGATGQASVSAIMTSSAQATLATNLTVAVRDKAVGAFNQIMAMQF